MENIFDSVKGSVFNTIAETFGYLAQWGTQTARVTFKDLTEPEKLGGADYSPNHYKIEYKQGDFIGMKEEADAHTRGLSITIKGREFLVKKVDAIIDGDCFIAHIYAK